LEIGGLWFKASPGKKVSEIPISTNNPGMVAYACHLSYARGHRKEDHGLRLDPYKNSRPYQNNN
jgi:hypothetical protein